MYTLNSYRFQASVSLVRQAEMELTLICPKVLPHPSHDFCGSKSINFVSFGSKLSELSIAENLSLLCCRDFSADQTQMQTAINMLLIIILYINNKHWMLFLCPWPLLLCHHTKMLGVECKLGCKNSESKVCMPFFHLNIKYKTYY